MSTVGRCESSAEDSARHAASPHEGFTLELEDNKRTFVTS